MTMQSGKERCLLINISESQWFSLGVAAVTQYILLAERINARQSRHTYVAMHVLAVRIA